MRSIYSPDTEARPSVKKNSVASEASTIAQSHPEQNHRAHSWRRIAFQAVLLAVLFFGALVWMQRDFRNPEIPDWQPVLVVADTAQEKGDLYYAESLYSQVARLAAWREDWAGLIAAACAMKNLDEEKGRYSTTNALLLRAMIAAQTKQSRSGMATVAKAFVGLGEDKVASMILSRVQKDWTEEANDSAHVLSPGCWAS